MGHDHMPPGHRRGTTCTAYLIEELREDDTRRALVRSRRELVPRSMATCPHVISALPNEKLGGTPLVDTARQRARWPAAWEEGPGAAGAVGSGVTKGDRQEWEQSWQTCSG